ncbi:MAG: glycosyltransferase 87 family protein [Flavobacteriaceae bacterium]|nr:glycosyltransferase 87 family protein [Flavobacteriaceae bacterium]
MNFLKNNKTPLFLVFLSVVFYAVFASDLNRNDFIKLISLIGVLFFISYKLQQINLDRFWFLAGVGVVFRLVFIGVIPNLSQDFYRFIWDGRLVFQGVNPYLFTPESFLNGDSSSLGMTFFQAQELHKGMGTLNGSHFSNYPPINQLLFAIAALFAGKSILGSVIVMRIVIILADVGILYFGRKLLVKLRQDPDKIFWYFLNPFIIIELTGNLHFEGVMLFFVIWSLYLLYQKKWLRSAVVLGVSVSVKLIPLLFLPLYYQWFVSQDSFKKGFLKLFLFYLIIVGTAALTFLPFYSPQFVSNFSETIALWFQNFEFNASVYYIIRWIGFKIVGWNIIETVGKILPLIVIGFLLILTFFRKNKNFQQLITVMLFGISFYYLLSTTIHPWYIATPLLLSVFTKYKFPIVWSLLVMLSYSAYGKDGFSENLWWVATEYILVMGCFIWEFFKERKEALN